MPQSIFSFIKSNFRLRPLCRLWTTGAHNASATELPLYLPSATCPLCIGVAQPLTSLACKRDRRLCSNPGGVRCCERLQHLLPLWAMQAGLRTATRRSKAIFPPPWSACSTIGNVPCHGAWQTCLQLETLSLQSEIACRSIDARASLPNQQQQQQTLFYSTRGHSVWRSYCTSTEASHPAYLAEQIQKKAANQHGHCL